MRRPDRPHGLSQQPVVQSLEQIAGGARRHLRPGAADFALDVEAVADEMKPPGRGPGDALLGANLVADDDVAAVADAPAQRNGAQAEVIFLPAWVCGHWTHAL